MITISHWTSIVNKHDVYETPWRVFRFDSGAKQGLYQPMGDVCWDTVNDTHFPRGLFRPVPQVVVEQHAKNKECCSAYSRQYFCNGPHSPNTCRLVD